MRFLNFKFLSLTLMLAMAMGGCTGSPEKHGDAITYLLLWPVDGGGYTLQEITLTTLDSPYELKGSAAEIYFQSALDESGYSGPVARPHLTKAGGVYIPTDIESAQAVTAYAQFEKLYLYEQRLGTASQLSWPRKVGVEIRLSADAPNGVENNANYFSKFDAIALLPFSLGEGVPVGMNIGITAHEHFHAHFQQEVMAKLTASVGDVEKLEDSKFRTAHERNNFVLRAWNEGLADFFATTYTRIPDFFKDSMPAVAPFRKLDAPLTKFGDEEEFLRVGTRFPGARLNYSYQQGTVLARLLHALVNTPGVDQDEFLRQVLLNLKNIPPLITKTYDSKLMAFDLVVPPLLAGMSLNKEMCALLSAVVSDAVKAGSFSQCSVP